MGDADEVLNPGNHGSKIYEPVRGQAAVNGAEAAKTSRFIQFHSWRRTSQSINGTTPNITARILETNIKSKETGGLGGGVILSLSLVLSANEALAGRAGSNFMPGRRSLL